MATRLNDVIERTHDTLSEQLDKAQAALPDGAGSRRGFPPIDRFVAGASQHLHAVDTVLVPTARDVAPEQCEQLAEVEHELSFALEHLRRRVYGSPYEKELSWEEQWTEVRDALRAYCEREDQLVSALNEQLDEPELSKVSEKLASVRDSAPPRPHPYMPKRGPVAAVMRRVARVADVFMDTVDDRYSPAAFESPEKRTEHKEKGAVSQYLLADPHIEDDETPQSEGD